MDKILSNVRASSAECANQTKVNSISEYDRLSAVEENTKRIMDIISQWDGQRPHRSFRDPTHMGPRWQGYQKPMQEDYDKSAQNYTRTTVGDPIQCNFCKKLGHSQRTCFRLQNRQSRPPYAFRAPQNTPIHEESDD